MRGGEFFELADIAANARRGKNAAAISPIALEAVRRIDALFEIERAINGLLAAERLRRPPGAERAARRRSGEPGCAIERVPPVALGRRRRADRLHAQALGRLRPLPRRRADLPHQQRRRAGAARLRAGPQGWLFAGSERGADRAAAMATLITTAKLNDVDPQAWLADVLARINAIPARALDELLPWIWKASQAGLATAA